MAQVSVITGVSRGYHGVNPQLSPQCRIKSLAKSPYSAAYLSCSLAQSAKWGRAWPGPAKVFAALQRTSFTKNANRGCSSPVKTPKIAFRHSAGFIGDLQMAKHEIYNEKTATTAAGKITDLRVVWFDTVTRKPVFEFVGTDLPIQQLANMAAYGMAQQIDAGSAHKNNTPARLDALRKRVAAIRANEYKLGERGPGMADPDVYDAAVAAGVFGDSAAERDVWKDLSKPERTVISQLPSVAAELKKRRGTLPTQSAVLAKFTVVKKAPIEPAKQS